MDEAASIFRRLHDAVKTRACRWTPDPDPLQRVVMLAALVLLVSARRFWRTAWFNKCWRPGEPGAKGRTADVGG